MVAYKRKPWKSLGLLVLGFLFLLDVIRDSDFNLVYDSIKLLVGVAQIGIGGWGLLTPLVSIDGRQLIIHESAFSSRIIDLKSTSVVLDTEQLHLSGEAASYTFPLHSLRATDRQEFIFRIRQFSAKLA